MPFRWSYNRMQAWAVVAGTTVDVVGFQVDFELNAIPRATIRLPLGRSAVDGSAAAIHTMVQDLSEQQPVQLYVAVAATPSDDSVRSLGIPTAPFLLFDGFTAGGGYARNNQGTAQYVLACNHWLVQLNQASALSQSSYQGNPANYSYGALMLGGGLAETGAKESNWTVVTGADTLISTATLPEDAWGKAFYPWFLRQASRDGFWLNERNLKGDGSNKQALAALEKMKPAGAGYVPSRFRTTLDGDAVAAVARSVARMTGNPSFVANQTMWDILVGAFAPAYLLALVPRVATALVVPYIPGNRGTDGAAFAQIRADEYVGIQLDAAMRRPLRAYGILSGSESETGAAGGVADDAPPRDDGAPSLITGVGGWFDTEKSGAVVIGRAPDWIAASTVPSLYSAEASGGVLKPISNALAPGAGTAPVGKDGMKPIDHARARAGKVVKPLLDAYAQARYAQEVLQGRQGVVVGVFRVDIAPGSLVEIEGASEQFIADLDAFGIPYFGEVLRVSHTFDAEAKAIGTAFHVGYVRTAVENRDDRTSVDGHPVYRETFQGVALVDDGESPA